MKKGAYDTAVSFIAKRDYCSFELTKKLLNKGFSVEEIEKAIDSILKAGYIEDEKIIQEMIKKRLDKHPEGKYRLRAYLCSKGIPEHEADKYLMTITPNIIADCFCKWLKENSYPDEKKDMIKYFRARGINEDEAECIFRILGKDVSE